MMKNRQKARYTHSLKFLKSGYLSIRETITQLVSSSSLLLDNGAHSQAASLAVIALEECGKIILLDSLLFSKPDDDYAKGFKKGSLSHKDKLLATQFFVVFLKALSEHDKRNSDVRFKKAVQIGMLNLHENYKELRDSLPNADIHELDRIKQEGFYTKLDGQSFSPTTETLSPQIAEKINKLACAMKSNMEFIMTPQSVSAYVKAAEKLRGELSVEEWEKVRDIVDETVTATFQNLTPAAH
ncbi:AbiV family abortive infection protein [Porticoccaceae bacterium]|nr:AbiV family abortive infection protein [Porticoccaceae bacterium]